MHFLVGIAAITFNDRMCQMPFLDIGLIVELEDNAITEFLFIRTQGADEVTETFRQHRNGTVDEVDARRAVVGFLVDSGTFFHIMAHIGDMHTDLPKSAVELADGERIIEVLGILGIDGAGEDIAEILTAGNLLLGDGGIDLLSSILHILGILIRQVVLREDGMHLGIVLAGLSQHIDYGANDVLMLMIRPLCDLYHCLVIGLAALQLALRDNDIMDEGRILRNEEGPVLVDTQLSDNLIVGATDNLDDHRLLDMLVATGHIGDLHLVAVHRRHRVTLRHKHGCSTIIGQERVTAIGFAAEGSLLYLRLHVQTIGIVADLTQEVVPCHLFHRIDGEHLQRMGVELQRLEYLLEREGLVRIVLEEVLEQFNDLLLTESFASFFLSHRVVIALVFCKDSVFY